MIWWKVAPRAGAWIEISSKKGKDGNVEVAPRAGAWIEIFSPGNIPHGKSVAPRAGAWIEISGVGGIDIAAESRPARARGLKSLLTL